MKKIICTGIILMAAGCVPAVMGEQSAASIAAGWYGPHKTDLELSRDMDHCHTACLSA